MSTNTPDSTNNNKQVPTLELPEAATPYKSEGQLYKDLMDRIECEAGRMSLVSVVGVLELCKSCLIETQD